MKYTIYIYGQNQNQNRGIRDWESMEKMSELQTYTATCRKPNNTPEMYSNCAEVHQANYRGCTVTKEFKKRASEQNKKHMIQKLSRKKITEQTFYAVAPQANSQQKNNLTTIQARKRYINESGDVNNATNDTNNENDYRTYRLHRSKGYRINPEKEVKKNLNLKSF